jgi:hypothetical protein
MVEGFLIRRYASHSGIWRHDSEESYHIQNMKSHLYKSPDFRTWRHANVPADWTTCDRYCCIQQVHLTGSLQSFGHVVKSYCTYRHDKIDAISVYNLLKKVRFVEGLLCLIAGEPWLQDLLYNCTFPSQKKPTSNAIITCGCFVRPCINR